MTERHAFLRAIKANPDDDTPRLVYADWLEEHAGYSDCVTCRGTGVNPFKYSAPTAPAECPSCPAGRGTGRKSDGSAERAKLIRECAARQGDLHADLDLTLGQDCRGVGLAHWWHRGVLRLVECSWRCWREHGDAIWERELPWKVRLTTEPEEPEELGRSKRAMRLKWAGREFEWPCNVSLIGHGQWSHVGLVAVLAARWPGIDFELPPAREGMGREVSAQYMDEFASLNNTEFMDVMRRFIRLAAGRGQPLPTG